MADKVQSDQLPRTDSGATSRDPIPVCRPTLTEEDIRSVERCLREGWISSTGPYVESFEKRWAEYCGMNHGIAVANGTVALEVACSAVGLGPGDEVILPSFTIISSCQAVTKLGATPVLVDVDPATWQMDPNQVAQKMTDRTRAIMVVHMYGHPVDMDPIMDLARQYDCHVIEDAAEVHGARYKGRLCGGIGSISCFSFFANKIITTGEGGMILTSNHEWAARCRSERNLCFVPERRFLHYEIGDNYRLTNIQAALGCSQLDRLDSIVERKREIAQQYRDRLWHRPEIRMQERRDWADPVYWVVGVVIDEKTGLTATDCMKALAASGIETRPFFLGMHEQPVYLRQGLFQGERYPVTDRLARQGFYLPNGLDLSDDEISYVCDSLLHVIGGV